MKKFILFIIFSLFTNIGNTQQDTLEISHKRISDTIYSLLQDNINFSSGRLVNKTLNLYSQTFVSKAFANTNDTINADKFYNILSELKTMSFDTSTFINNLDYFYKANDIVSKYDFDEEKTVIPLGIIDIDYQYLNEELAISDGLITLDNWRYNFTNTNQSLQNVVTNHRVQICSPVYDYISDKTMYFYLTKELFISNSIHEIEKVELFLNNNWITLPFDELFKIDLKNSLFQIFDVKVTYDNLNSFSNKFIFITPENYIKDNLNEKNDEVYSVCNSSGHIEEGVCKLEWCKVENFCEEKPYIVVTGYRPPMFGQKFKKTWELYSNWHNNLLQSIYDNGFDIFIVKFNIHQKPQQHGMVESADLFVRFMDEIGITAEYESVIQASSMGHDIARLALLKMEKRHWEGSTKQHHARLLIAYDANVYGANIPLSYQTLIYSCYLHPEEMVLQGEAPLIRGFLRSFLFSAMIQKSTKELLMYHVDASANYPFLNPFTDYNFIASHSSYRDIFLNHLEQNDNHEYFFPLPNTLRNISISLGKISGTNDSESSLNFNTPGSFWRDLDNLFLKYYVKSAIYNPNSYSKIFHHRQSVASAVLLFFGIPVPILTVNQKLSVNKMLHIDNVSGSYLNGFGNIITVSDFAYFGFGTIQEGFGDLISDDGDVDAVLISSGWNQFTHKPVITALGINPRYWHPDYGGPADGSMSVIVHGLKLMYNQYDLNYDNLELQSNHYGYPHLGRPTDHFEVTPFEAIYIDDHIDNHINLRYANQTDNDILNGFILNEVEPWYLGLQNHRLGSQARPDFYYIAKRRAKVLITLGKHVTPTTDDGDYEILPNADLRLEAGETIHFTNGFHAHAGCNMHAKIYYQDCSGMGPQLRKGNTNADAIETPSSYENLENLSLKNSSDGIVMFPNPSSTNLTIHSDDKIEQIKIFNISGLELNSFQIAADDKRYFITHTLKRGSYLLHLKKEEEIIVKQFVVL